MIRGLIMPAWCAAYVNISQMQLERTGSWIIRRDPPSLLVMTKGLPLLASRWIDRLTYGNDTRQNVL